MAKKNSSNGSILPLLLGAALILVGLSVFLFPKIRFAMFQKNAEEAKTQFNEVIQTKQEEIVRDPKMEELYERLRKENERLYEYQVKGNAEAMEWKEPEIDFAEYGLEKNTIGYVTIEKLNVTLPIVAGEASDENMRIGAVNLPNTSYAIGGINTNSVLAAHRGSTIGAMFRNIHLLEPGDKVIIENFREKLVYEMVRYQIIEPEQNQYLEVQEGKDLITLYSCHPLGQNKQRLLVFCERVTDES